MQNNQEYVDDRTLVSECLQNPNAYVNIVNRFEKRLSAFARRHSGLSFEEVEDVLQEAFVRLFVHLNDYDPRLKLENWLFRIVRNLLIDDFRKKKEDESTSQNRL